MCIFCVDKKTGVWDNKKNMKSATKEWLKFVEADWQAVKILFANGQKMGSAYLICVFHCHQAVEKTLKALLIELGVVVPKIHDLVRLSELADVQLPEKFQRFIKEINPHYLPLRYPDLNFKPKFSFAYNRKNTQVIINKTRQILVCLKGKLLK